MTVLVPLIGLAAIAAVMLASGKAKAGSAASGQLAGHDVVESEGPFPVRGVEYQIRPGDTASGIAARYTKNQLRWREIISATNAYAPKYPTLSVVTENRKELVTKDNPFGEITLVKPFATGQIIVLPAEWFE